MSATACGLLATEVSRAGARVAALPPGSDSEGLGRPGSGASRSWWCCLGAGASPSKSLAGAEQEVGGGLLAGAGSCTRCGEGRSWGHGLCALGSSPGSRICVSSAQRFLNRGEHGARSGPSHRWKLCVWVAPQWAGGCSAGSRVCAGLPGEGGRGSDGRPASVSTHCLWHHGLAARLQSGPNPQPLES